MPPAIVFCRSRLTPGAEPIFGLRIALPRRWKLAAVTGELSLNFKPSES